jgi:hypothetical protein
MLPVSEAFLDAVRSSHAIVSRARIITPGATGADPPGFDLAVVDGGVTLDGTADVRGSLDLTVAEAWPADATTADLVPYGTEIAVSRGIVFGNGRIERAPLGIYRITDVEQSEAPSGPLRITASDRMSGIIDARMPAPVQYLASQTVGDVVTDLVQAVYPAAVIEWDDTTDTETLDRAQVVEEDRYAFLRDLVASYGKVMFFDYRGVLVVRTVPAATVPVWEVAAGPGGVLVGAGRSRSRDGVYNAVVATGEALDDRPPPYGVARDDDPTSVTYWDGAFGKVPQFYSSPFITTDAQALSAAGKILTQARGLPYAVDFTAVPNPALEPLDVVRLVYPPVLGRSPAAATEVHVLDQLAIPLSSGGELKAGTRLQTTTGGV